jgi:hypothetical protein
MSFDLPKGMQIGGKPSPAQKQARIQEKNAHLAKMGVISRKQRRHLQKLRKISWKKAPKTENSIDITV